VTDPSPSKAAPAAKTIVTTRPSETATPPASGRTGGARSTGRGAMVSAEARDVASPLHKPVPGRTQPPVQGGDCAPAGAKARSATGDRLICEVFQDTTENTWNDEH